MKKNVFDQVRYQLQTPVELLHTKDWAVEFKLSGNLDPRAMQKILSTTDAIGGGVCAIALHSASNRLTITQYSSSAGTHYQYGLFLDKSFPLEQPHVFRLVNHVDENDTGTVMLYIDGQQVGAMNTPLKDSYPIDLPATLDMKMQYIGAQSYHLTGGTLHYIQVEQSGALDVQ